MREIAFEDVREKVPVCTAIEEALAGSLHSASKQLVVLGAQRGTARFAVPTVDAKLVLESLRAFWYPTPALCARREQNKLAQLIRAVHTQCATSEYAERHRVTIDADPVDVSCIRAFTLLPGAKWVRGILEVELPDHAALGYAEPWHFCHITSIKSVKRGVYSDGAECAEIVCRTTSKRSQGQSMSPAPLILFTDGKRLLGLRFSRRVWADRGATLIGGPRLPTPTDEWDPRNPGPKN